MSCCKNNKPVNVNNSSGIILKKKASPVFFKISSISPFSINGTSNNQSYIGNPNTAISYVGCRGVDKTTKISVKNYSAYLKTRIVNNKLICNPVNSFDCHKKIFPINNINKHFNNNNLNKDNDSRIQKLKSNVYKCYLDNKNCNDYINNKSKCNVKFNIQAIRTKLLTNKCNITKDKYCTNVDVPDYSIYTKKRCLYDPPDAKVIAC